MQWKARRNDFFDNIIIQNISFGVCVAGGLEIDASKVMVLLFLLKRSFF